MSIRIAVALDNMPLEHCKKIAEQLGQHARLHSLKIHDLFDREGPGVIDQLTVSGARVWVDFKLHDVFATIRHRALALRDAGADILTVHAQGGVDMMRAAAESGAEILAVTILTSQKPRLETIKKHATMAAVAGVSGIVCPAYAIPALLQNKNLASLPFVTPGIRSLTSPKGSHYRTHTIVEAIRAGSHVIVVGEEITHASDPIKAFYEMVEAIEKIEHARTPS